MLPDVRPIDNPDSQRTASRTINGSQLDVACYAFDDRTLVLVSQLGKIGYIVRTLLTGRSAH